MAIHEISIVVILISLCLWLLYYFINKKNQKISNPIDNKAVGDYLENYFSNYEIVKEILPDNTNKIFHLRKDSKEYILKITCKNKKRARREAAFLQELESRIPVPKIISSQTQTLPGHLLMSYCGVMLSESNNHEDYFNFGKIIRNISEVQISKHNKRFLKKNCIGWIEKLSSQVEHSHPYAQYFTENQHLPKSYFCHGEMHAQQAVLQTDGKVSIIDWENAGLSYRVLDLSRALSDVLKRKQCTDYALAVLSGYNSTGSISDKQEIKLLLSLIWFDLNKTYYLWLKTGQLPKRANFVKPLLIDRSLEDIFGLKLD